MLRTLIGALALTGALVVPSVHPALAQTAAFCRPGEAPAFRFGFAALSLQLGPVMGDPIECEHPDASNGDTLETTTTGLAFYRSSTNTPTFTDGSTHWALTDQGMVTWTGKNADPPGSQSPVTPAPVAAPAVPSTGPQPGGAPQRTEADIASLVSPSVVEVLTPDGHGSGVGVSAGVITNAHVVDGAGSIAIATADGRTAPATVTRIDHNADLALLRTSLAIPPVEMEFMADQRQGDEVLIFGYPLDLRVSPGGQCSLTSGLISGTGTEQGSGRALIQTDAAVNPGNSGGAMVNLRGKLIGLPTFGVSNAQNVNFAVAADTVSAFLSAPQASVAPAPRSPAYRGDPRPIALTLADAGNGLAFDSQDVSKLSSGYYKVVYSNSSKVLYSYVHVYESSAVAQDLWNHVFTQLDPAYESYWTALSMGDAAFTTRNADGDLVRAYALAKNVVVSVTLDSPGPKPTADVAGSFLRVMVNRVNSLAT
jgi:S1-C subfamily serine protease